MTTTTGILGVSVLPDSEIVAANANLVLNTGDCAFWFDPSDSTTRVSGTTPNKIVSVIDKVASRVYRYGGKASNGDYLSQSAADNLDTISFAAPGLKLDNSWWYCDGNPVDTGAVKLTSIDGEMTYFAVLKFNPSPNAPVPLLLFGGRENAGRLYEGGLSTNSISFTQMPGGSPSQANIRIHSLDSQVSTTTLVQLAQQTTAVARVSFKRTGADIEIKVSVNGVLCHTELAPFSAFAEITSRSFGIDTSIGNAQSSIGEVVAYRTALTDQQITEIEDYLNFKWFKLVNVVSIGDLDSRIGIVGQQHQTTVEIINGETVTITAPLTDGISGWTATRVNQNDTTWHIQGVFPPSITDFYIDINATNLAGDNSAQKRFKMIGTATGTIPSEKSLYESVGTLGAWIDASDPTCITYNNDTGRISAIRERTTTAKFLTSSSETPTRDSLTFSADALAFAKRSESTSGLNYGLVLDLSTYPELNVVDPTDYEITHNGGYVNHPRANGLPMSGEDGTYTVILVASYNGRVGGPAAGDMYIGTDFPKHAPEYYVQQLGLTSDSMQSDYVSIEAMDAGSTVLDGANFVSANFQYKADAIAPATKFIAVWRKQAGAAEPEMLIGTTALTESLVRGSYAAWSAVSQKFSQIAGAHALGSVGEMLIYQSAISDVNLASVVNHLSVKWLTVAAQPPTFTNLSDYDQYVGRTYNATVLVTNGSNDQIADEVITCSAGTNWTFVADQNNAHIYHISGLMPTVAQDITMTLEATQSGERGVGVFTIHALAMPDGPTIGTLSPVSGDVSSNYEGQVTILNADSASIAFTAGSGWTIEVDDNDATLYHVTGVMPSVVTAFGLTISAVKHVADLVLPAIRAFTINTVSGTDVRPSQYPLDLTGLLAGNRVQEIQTLSADNGQRRQMAIPALAPFYFNNILVEYKSQESTNWREAEPYLDYQPVCEFIGLTRAAAFPIYGALTFMNTTIEGNIRLTYQTLGGNFVLDRKLTYELLAQRAANQREIEWSQVIGLKSTYPVDTHEHLVDTDLIGMSGFTSAMTAVGVAYTDAAVPDDVQAMVVHIADHDNPHNVTAGDIGLPLVANYATATPSQARDQTRTALYITPNGAANAALQHIVHATSGDDGTVMLNQGTQPGDATDNTKVLTAAGLYALMTSTAPNEIQTAFASGDASATFSPYPLTFPCYWRGIQVLTMEELMFAIQTYVGVSPLAFDNVRGELFFPRGVPPCSLVTTQTAGNYATRDFTTDDPMSLPMRIPVV